MNQYLDHIDVDNGLVQSVHFSFISAGDLPPLVTSAFGRTGDVVAVAGDYTAAQVTNAADKTAANTFTAGPQTVAIAADGSKGVVIKQHSGTQSANLLDLADSAGTTISEFDSAGNLGVRSTNFTEIVPTGGTCRFVVETAVAGQRIGYQPNFGGFLSCTDGTIIAYVASPQAGSAGLVLGTFTSHNVTIRTANTSYSQFLVGGIFYTSSYAGPSPLPVEMITGILSNGSTSVVNNVTCSRFDGAGGAASDGIGAGHLFRVNTSTTFGVACAQIDGSWNDSTHATREGRLTGSAYDSSGLVEGWRTEASSGVAKLGFFGGSAVVQPTNVTPADALEALGLATSVRAQAVTEAAGEVLGATAATVGLASYTTDGSAATDRINVWVLVRAILIDVLQARVTFTDEQTNAQTITILPLGGGTLAATGFYCFPAITIRPGTFVAVSVDIILSTGGGSVTYDAGAVIERIH